MQRPGRGGRPFEREKSRIKATATYCERPGCGKPISAVFPWPDPRCVTVGHIVPLAYGGDPLDPDNLRAECLACNTAEGARMTNAARSGKLDSYENGDW